MTVNSIGVVGAGQMGNGIAHVMALAGYDVVLNDISKDALDRATDLIGRNMDRQVSREKITQDERDQALTCALLGRQRCAGAHLRCAKGAQ